MRKRQTSIVLFLVAASIIVWFWAGKSTAQTDAGNAASYTAGIEKIMGSIGRGKINEAMNGMDFLKDHPEQQDAIRDELDQINNQQQEYYGYDIVAVQRFSERVHLVSVLAYYQKQPVLIRFDVYHPKPHDGQPWTIAGFHVEPELSESLKDVPVDYPGHGAAR